MTEEPKSKNTHKVERPVDSPDLIRIWSLVGIDLEWHDLLSPSTHNFPDIGCIFKDKLITILLILLPLTYGGIHLAAWNFEFASNTELLMWKIACLVIMGDFIIALGIHLSALGSKFIAGRIYPGPRFANLAIDDSYTSFVRFFDKGRIVFYIILFIPYALSRVYIVVEAFISLRHVPIGAYASVPWVQEIPHM